MSGPCEPRFSRLVDRAFTRGLPARQRRQLREHLAGCPSCRERWDRLAIIDRQLGGPALTSAMVDDIGDAVVSGATRTPRHRWWAITAGLAAAAAVMLLVLVRRDGAESTFTPRGGPHAHGRTPGVRLFCVSSDRDHVIAETRMVSDGPVPELRCTIADDLQLAYSTPDREALTMVAFARLDSAVIHYAPPEAGEAVALRADRVDELVDWSTRLAARHRSGTYDVIVRFFDRDVSTTDATENRIAPVAELRARLEVVPRGELVDAQ